MPEQQLSQKRAEAVVKYLTEKGVNGARLSAKGYGQDKPVADNKTKAGQGKNRRIEFKLEFKTLDERNKDDASATHAAPGIALDQNELDKALGNR